jgi:hypothetical protein
MIRSIGRRQSVAAITAAACMALVGCGADGDEPVDSGLPSDSKTTPTATTSPASESSPTPPAEPDNIDNTSPAAAKAFARHVVDLINYSGTTQDIAPLRAVFASSCKVCDAGLKGMEEVIKEGARVKGGKWSVKYLRYYPGSPREAPLIDIIIKATTERIFHPDRSKPDVNPGFRSNYTWKLQYSKKLGWQLSDWTKVS